MQRFWQLSSGEISIDGQRIADVPLASLRRQVAPASQDVFLFEGTVRENLVGARRIGRRMTFWPLRGCARRHIHQEAAAGDYNTQVGDSGDDRRVASDRACRSLGYA